MSDEKNDSKFVVKDNRRFDAGGNERPEEKREPTQAKKESSPQEREFVKVDSVERALNEGAVEEIDFSSFILSLGTQALMQLGVLQPPDGVAVPVDKGAAKQTIDIISMLEQKTKGNLDPSELKLLTEILHNIRMSFVRATK